jgi:hypothetical protein
MTVIGEIRPSCCPYPEDRTNVTLPVWAIANRSQIGPTEACALSKNRSSKQLWPVFLDRVTGKGGKPGQDNLF